MMLNENCVIDARQLVKIYRNGAEQLKVLDNVSIKVNKGDFIAILGPSGSGKSTLMNILGCLDTPTAGQYYLDGVDVLKASDNELADMRNQKIGFIFQKFNLLPRLTAEQNVMLPLLYRGMAEEAARQLAREKLTILGLGDRLQHRPNELSGGQQQRVAIARAIVGSPQLLLADEPTGNLDSKSSGDAMEIFKELNRRGNTIVIITHDIEVAEQVKKIVYLRDGKIYEN
ncbi:ABC transporter ATP-binding protein [Desulforamulus hydrothermalis]|uniref:Putative transporter subunit: ATP-binding component of ABC superfamily n=1 Tax=Desulforamulus hydrothermalis Lam5 = DSM 18033 TaxID=1121428 RepID=K8EHP8_9FIRM|nr:ABC transporter ATP-binding protein [Desulforamulus hydrothermalis]CCO08161.1 putative transporter subunit: ATP-binding component of ABC superfamily [Desulforamulus hydrothermalis Lam5 = DSM 18033]SHH23469.1 putative ABC transport system ATP-binding protein [Desulforamulus hydrothermalis Lam5 = DSM 18033]